MDWAEYENNLSGPAKRIAGVLRRMGIGVGGGVSPSVAERKNIAAAEEFMRSMVKDVKIGLSGQDISAIFKNGQINTQKALSTKVLGAFYKIQLDKMGEFRLFPAIKDVQRRDVNGMVLWRFNYGSGAVIYMLKDSKTGEIFTTIEDFARNALPVNNGVPAPPNDATKEKSLPPLIPGSTNGAPGASSSLGGNDKTPPAFVGSVIGSLTSSSLSATEGASSIEILERNTSSGGVFTRGPTIWMAAVSSALTSRLDIRALIYKVYNKVCALSDKVRVGIDNVIDALTRTFGAIVGGNTTNKFASGSPAAEKGLLIEELPIGGSPAAQSVDIGIKPELEKPSSYTREVNDWHNILLKLRSKTLGAQGPPSETLGKAISLALSLIRSALQAVVARGLSQKSPKSRTSTSTVKVNDELRNTQQGLVPDGLSLPVLVSSRLSADKDSLSAIVSDLFASSGLSPPWGLSRLFANRVQSFLSELSLVLINNSVKILKYLTRPQVLLTVAGIGLFAAFVVNGGFWLSALPDLTLARTLLTTSFAIFGLGLSWPGILPSVAGGVYPFVVNLADAVLLLLTQPSVLISTVAGVLGTAAIVVIGGFRLSALPDLTLAGTLLTTLIGGVKWLSLIIQNSALNTWLSLKMTAQSSLPRAPATIVPGSSSSTNAPVMPIPVTAGPTVGSPLANTTLSLSGTKLPRLEAVSRSTGSPALTPAKVTPHLTSPTRGEGLLVSGRASSALVSRIRNIAFFTFLTVAIGLAGMAMVKKIFFPEKPAAVKEKSSQQYSKAKSAGNAKENFNNITQHINNLLQVIFPNEGVIYRENMKKLLLVTAMVESGYRDSNRVQQGGPARGLFQMEPPTAYDIIHTYVKYRPWANKLFGDILGERYAYGKIEKFSHKELAKMLENDDKFSTFMAILHYKRAERKIEKSGIDLRKSRLNQEKSARIWVRYYNAGGKGTIKKYKEADELLPSLKSESSSPAVSAKTFGAIVGASSSTEEVREVVRQPGEELKSSGSRLSSSPVGKISEEFNGIYSRFAPGQKKIFSEIEREILRVYGKYVLDELKLRVEKEWNQESKGKIKIYNIWVSLKTILENEYYERKNRVFKMLDDLESPNSRTGKYEIYKQMVRELSQLPKNEETLKELLKIVVIGGKDKKQIELYDNLVEALSKAAIGASYILDELSKISKNYAEFRLAALSLATRIILARIPAKGIENLEPLYAAHKDSIIKSYLTIFQNNI